MKTYDNDIKLVFLREEPIIRLTYPIFFIISLLYYSFRKHSDLKYNIKKKTHIFFINLDQRSTSISTILSNN